MSKWKSVELHGLPEEGLSVFAYSMEVNSFYCLVRHQGLWLVDGINVTWCEIYEPISHWRKTPKIRK